MAYISQVSLPDSNTANPAIQYEIKDRVTKTFSGSWTSTNIVSCPAFTSSITGAVIFVTFGSSALNTTSLNVNNKGAKAIYLRVNGTTASLPNNYFKTNQTYMFTYDGSNWILDSNTDIPGPHSHGNITDTGTISTSVTIANNDALVISTTANNGKIAKTTIKFDGTSTADVLSKKGTWTTLGTAAFKDIVTTVTSNTTSLPTSSAVAAFVEGKGYLTSQTTAKTIVGSASNSTSNAAVAASTNSIYLNTLEDTQVTSYHNIVGTGGTTVSSDANGKITINSVASDLPVASTSTLGGIKPAYTISGTATGFGGAAHYSGNIAANTRTTSANRYYMIEADKDGRMFVNVPWTNVNSGYQSTITNVAANSDTTGVYIRIISQTNGQISATTAITTVSNTWTNGTTAGPALQTIVNGVTSTSAVIPSASTTQSGIVTTTAQAFIGSKTFTGDSFVVKGDVIRFQNQNANTNQSGTNPYITSIHIGDSRNLVLDEYKNNHLAIRASSILLNVSSSISAYNSSSTYSTGTIVWYNSAYYICNTDITTAETWNANHWTVMPSSGIMAYGNVNPWKTNSYDLGSTSYYWRKLYIGTTSSYGSTTKPIYWNDGVPTAGSDYGGGTKVTLNGTDKGANTISIYAPTSGGTTNHILVSGGTAAPTWKATADGAAYATGDNSSVTFGTLPVLEGGTGSTSFTADCVIVPSGSPQKFASRGLKVTGSTTADVTITPSGENKTLNISANGTGNIAIQSTTGTLTISTTSGKILISNTFGKLELQGAAANTTTYSMLTLGNSTSAAGDNHSEGKIILYSAATQSHTLDGYSTTVAYTHTFPNSTGYVVQTNTVDKVGTPVRPVYIEEHGVVTQVTMVQKIAWQLNNGNVSTKLSSNSNTFPLNDRSIVANIVVTTGIAQLKAPITWETSNNYVMLRTATAVSGTVSGYILVIDGANSTSFTVVNA